MDTTDHNDAHAFVQSNMHVVETHNDYMQAQTHYAETLSNHDPSQPTDNDLMSAYVGVTQSHLDYQNAQLDQAHSYTPEPGSQFDGLAGQQTATNNFLQAAIDDNHAAQNLHHASENYTQSLEDYAAGHENYQGVVDAYHDNFVSASHHFQSEINLDHARDEVIAHTPASQDNFSHEGPASHSEVSHSSDSGHSSDSHAASSHDSGASSSSSSSSGSSDSGGSGAN